MGSLWKVVIDLGQQLLRGVAVLKICFKFLGVPSSWNS